MTDHPRIVMLMPYFGPWPQWMEFFLTTCRWNDTVDWLFLSDSGPPGRLGPNLRHRPMALGELRELAEQRIGMPLDLRDGYKVCDLRLAFGAIFDEHLEGYDWFGWGDVDVLYGNLRRFLTPCVLGHDLVTFNEQFLSGHFTIVRNTAPSRELHLRHPDFMKRVGEWLYFNLDEPPPHFLSGVQVLARNSFNTPLSTRTPWRDGRFAFPTEWRWEDGALTNDLDEGVEFLYLHFMHWKGGEWPRRCGNAQWERVGNTIHMDPRDAKHGFRINDTGFHPL